MQTILSRELGLIEFNRRVLAQAEDEKTPLLERLRFLCIVSSNLDEFFEVRVAWLKDMARTEPTRQLMDGATPKQALSNISVAAKALIEQQYSTWRSTLLPLLLQEDISFLRRKEWDDAQRAWIKDYFIRDMMPMLTPLGLDPSHPFPKLLNKSLNFAIELSGKDAFGRQSGIAIVQAPRILPRIIKLPENISYGKQTFVFLSSILHSHVQELFLGMNVKGCYQFRVTRDSDLTVEEEDIKNLRAAIQGELRGRQFGDAVRLEVADTCPSYMSDFLLSQFNLTLDDLYRVDGPVNLVRLMSVPDLVERADLKFPPFSPSIPSEIKKHEGQMFDVIRKNDLLLYHPYQSFQPVVDFLQQAAVDTNVVAIKMTVYRTGSDSDMMNALITAALTGKQVTVIVELMARFDEEANINWASRLESSGAHVVYGVFGYKIHAKMLMIVRREAGALKRFVHLGTGNYHQRTARLYTDFGLLTCNEKITEDVNDLFTQITGLGQAGQLNMLYQSPFTLHDMILKNIKQEIEHAKAGKKALIVAKMNALVESKVIEALYEASNAGVQIELIVRGVCALRPGIKGLSENIHVRSIVGRFLEHSRVFYFYNDNDSTVFIASADWMGRNFFRRIETCVPIVDPKLKRRVIREGLRIFLKDNQNAWDMQSDGSYKHKGCRSVPFSAQLELLETYTAT